MRCDTVGYACGLWKSGHVTKSRKADHVQKSCSLAGSVQGSCVLEIRLQCKGGLFWKGLVAKSTVVFCGPLSLVR